MPYTPPSQRSPAASAPHSPNISRRSSYQNNTHPHVGHRDHHQSHSVSSRPELPRSTSYLTRHRRTPSVNTTTTFEPASEPSPPGTATQQNDSNALKALGSLRQSPPPLTNNRQMPAGAVMSPPDSPQQSSDDEMKSHRDRELKNLAELQAAIRIIEQTRETSPDQTAEQAGKANQYLTSMPPSQAEAKLTATNGDRAKPPHHIRGHQRSKTDTPVFVGLGNDGSTESPLTGSDEESVSDGDGSDLLKRGLPMLRKKSGELVRPALRPSSARRRPSSMPGTPTFSKAVHFDANLEHVRHFLQLERPMAVSAGSSPVEAYDSDAEFPFGEDGAGGRNPPFDWEITVANFPNQTPERLAQPVRVERVFLSADNKTLVGTVAVANLAFNKLVVARFTLDYWKTTSEVVAEYSHDVRQPKHSDGYDRFNFYIRLADQANLEAKTLFFCVRYNVNGQEYWDNNNSINFQVDFRKKHKPQNGKKGPLGAASRPVGSLPRSGKKSPQASEKPKSTPPTFDDFADGFDSKYKFDLRQPVGEVLGDPSSSLRLKGVKSAVDLSDNLTRRNPNGQAFGNRYDFGASLSAAIQAANSVLGDRSGLTMKPPAKKRAPRFVMDAEQTTSPVAMTSSQSLSKPSPQARTGISAHVPTPESPRPHGTEKPIIASQSYNELLDKYCFFGSAKNSPQLKDGTLRSGKYEGSSDSYVLNSADSTATNSPLMMEKKPSPPRTQTPSNQGSRSASPAPMTDLIPVTSPGYLYNNHATFPFHDTHTPTAILG
ncbi:uncharacterized protein BP5553_10385 [Venustampulla echinocandica]|uniref:CBM21 domain-containing protein n=1 Tax=Venustampulla echinocandica TaxID=2656787 RepID=A0A370T957_9HELO|nr:uncharacterized protein BP5553_10385 [Venustampulla echinocandica]RDL30107.1 hypothetical protein BP5553_10385 [Venustampulla echinocandica]